MMPAENIRCACACALLAVAATVVLDARAQAPSAAGAALKAPPLDLPARVSFAETPRADVRVYEAGSLAPSAYRVVRHLPAGDWMTAFGVRTYASEEAALNALLNDAVRAGGDGVVNAQCRRADGIGAGSLVGGYYCHGNAIKRVSATAP